MLNTSVVFGENYKAKERIVINQGGTSSGKTVSILQCLAIKSLEEPGTITTIVGQDIPNLKRGALRDFENHVLCSGEISSKISSYNKSDRVYKWINGSITEFQSYDNEQDARSGKRHRLFINEANGIEYNVYFQLHLRTTVQTYIDYNPSHEFWVHEKLLRLPSNERKLIISDYRHNPFCSKETIKLIEALKDQDEDLWKVYGRGLTGKIEGLIYPNYTLIDEVPQGLDYCYGLDFGFNHPTALVKCYFDEDKVYVDEVLYESKLITAELIDKMRSGGVLENDTIFADSARPDTIEEIFKAKFNIHPSDKSVVDGINKIKSKQLYITKRSANLLKEIRSYKWKEDKNGKVLDKEPVKFMDDAMDAMRYAIYNYDKRPIYDYIF